MIQPDLFDNELIHLEPESIPDPVEEPELDAPLPWWNRD